MNVNLRDNLKNLIKHRNKWQVKFIIPKDVRWAFNNQTTYKRSTGCDLNDVEAAKIERNRIVFKFKSLVKAYRRGGKRELEALDARYSREQSELKLALSRLNNDATSRLNNDATLANPSTTEIYKDSVAHNIEIAVNKAVLGSKVAPKQEPENSNSINNRKHGPNVGTWINQRLLDKPREIANLKPKVQQSIEEDVDKKKDG